MGTPEGDSGRYGFYRSTGTHAPRDSFAPNPRIIGKSAPFSILFSHLCEMYYFSSLQPQTYAPEGYITKEGEIGKEIFFISKGQCEILSQDGGISHGILQGGDSFGSLSLLLKGKENSLCQSTYLL